MGYNTEFEGELTITPKLEEKHRAYLEAFANTRRMSRNPFFTQKLPDPIRKAVGLPVGDYGAYYVGGDNADSPDIVDYNEPPTGQPGLWCGWDCDDGSVCRASDGKNYDYIPWLDYLIYHFLEPWGYKLNGEVTWSGEEAGDIGKIQVKDNKIKVLRGKVVYGVVYGED